MIYTATTAAEKLGVNKSTVTRHLARAKLGTRAGSVIVLTEGEVKKLAKLIDAAKAGNPGPRKKDGTFSK